MTGAGDGVVRAWSGVMEVNPTMARMEPPELVTAFQAIPVREV